MIGGGGLVWEKVGIWASVTNWLHKSKKLFAVVGLSINELDRTLKQDLLWMVENAKLFAVRDQKSHALLDFHPQAQVLSDLTWISPANFSQSEAANKLRISLKKVIFGR